MAMTTNQLLVTFIYIFSKHINFHTGTKITVYARNIIIVRNADINTAERSEIIQIIVLFHFVKMPWMFFNNEYLVKLFTKHSSSICKRTKWLFLAPEEKPTPKHGNENKPTPGELNKCFVSTNQLCTKKFPFTKNIMNV